MEDIKNLEENISNEKDTNKHTVEENLMNNLDNIDDLTDNLNSEQPDNVNKDSEDQEEEYYFTAAELRKQKKRQEQRLKRVAKEEKYRNRNLGRMYKSSAAIAVFAGIMQIIMGLPKEDGMTNIMLGVTFICCGYLFYSMGDKADRDKKKQEENR